MHNGRAIYTRLSLTAFHSCSFLFLIKTIPSKEPVARAATSTPEPRIAGDASETDADGLGLAAGGAGDTEGLIAGDASETDADGLGSAADGAGLGLAVDGAGDTEGLCR
jgi:hypothetical protein